MRASGRENEEAWRRLKLTNAELRIVGSSSSQQRWRKQYGCEATFLGTLDKDELRSEYRQADLLCLPSLGDGFGLVVLEALACGTPALVTSNCCAGDLIRESENGFIVSPANLSELMARLEWAAGNRALIRQMRWSARATAELHPWSKFRQDLVKVLQSITTR
jgi:glycosyltransferase involved in cell wall biosynthesis